MIEPVQISVSLSDQTKLGITIFSTKNNDTPTLIISPAFGVKATYYKHFAKALSEKGITVVTADLRGHGLSSVRPDKENNYGFLEMINDLKAVVDNLKQANPKTKVYILGHSMGGQIGSLAVAKYPNHFAGLAMIGAPNVYYKGWSRFHYYRRKLLVYVLLPLFGKLIALFPKLKIGGYYTTQKQAAEWGYTGKTGNYKVIGDDFDYEEAMGNVPIPVLAIDIEDDLMAPKVAIKNLYQKFSSTSSLSTLTLTKAATDAKLSHINWPRTATEEMVESVYKWLKNLS